LHGLALEPDAAARLAEAHGDATKMAALDAHNIQALDGDVASGVPIVKVAERATDVHDVRVLADLGAVLMAGGDLV
ncbi:MAG TPA: hypothetical protein PK141_26810, partial [Polyangiaceae bacterium]|nr:hypothetical protein [Polyangiaceae bacterium]